ncbi:MAG: hypothetical protein N2255_06830, partial [Kiritimatiellae bacterium]|nr:hypothetical protein [Kiritimatiellia bacterium]
MNNFTAATGAAANSAWRSAVIACIHGTVLPPRRAKSVNDHRAYRPARRAGLGPQRLLQRASLTTARLFYIAVAGSSLREAQT